MKIIEQYLIAVCSKLPLRGRGEIKKELRSLLLDDLETKYGPSATEQDAGSLVTAFGTPSQVAARYRNSPGVIAPELSDLYFMLLGIVMGALAVAFTVVFVVEAIEAKGAGLWLLFAQVPVQLFEAGLAATGAVTLLFIAATRLKKKPVDILDDDWHVGELAGIVLEPMPESRIGFIVAMVVSAILSSLLAFHPQAVLSLEDLFLLSTLPLGHRIVLDVFRLYAMILAIIGVGEIAMYALRFTKRNRSVWMKIPETMLQVVKIVVLVVMILDKDLYVGQDGFWLAGFRTIFFIVMIVEAAELVASGVGKVTGRIEKMVG